MAAGKPDLGLSAFGHDVIGEMNRLGMLVDLSHVSHNTMRHVLQITKSPVIFSHTTAYTLAPIFRNVPDDVLRATAKNGGVVMVTFVERFLTPDGRRSTLSDVADHIMHIVAATGGVRSILRAHAGIVLICLYCRAVGPHWRRRFVDFF